MATPRLPFLWPMLYRSAERATIECSPAMRRRALHFSARRHQQTVQQRYGTANEPPIRVESDNKTQTGEKVAKTRKKAASPQSSTDKKASPVAAETQTKKEEAPVLAKASGGDTMLDAIDVPPLLSAAIGSSAASEKPVKSLLDEVPEPSLTPPKTETGEAAFTHDEHQPPIHAPHMEAPRYVHHFDTFGLVKRLEESGWKDDQSVTIMKAMRLMLADNLSLAQDALVSKSQVENEGYLFKAACSELRTEIATRRRGEQEKMRTERAQLQHEVETINQRFTQDSVVLKDELKGMFDDRKMSVRNEQREMESKVAELNYKITVGLQADSRSDIEGLRWIMTRRVIITLLTIVIMVLGSLKLYSNALHDKEMEQKRRAAMRSVGTQMNHGTGTEASMSTQTFDGEIVVNRGDNPAYVSLG